MTDALKELVEPSASADTPPREKSFLEKIATELWRLNEAQATGDLAALRRMDRHSVPPAAFHRLLARAGMVELSTASVWRWQAAVQIMAQRPDALRPGGLGEALCTIGVSERRLDMLLHARGPVLRDLARRTAIRIARNHDTLPYRDLCHLVLYDGQPEKTERADKVRIRIAQSYQRAQREKHDS